MSEKNKMMTTPSQYQLGTREQLSRPREWFHQ